MSVIRHSLNRYICSGEILSDWAFGKGEGCKIELERWSSHRRVDIFCAWEEARSTDHIGSLCDQKSETGWREWPYFLPRTKYIYTSVTGSSLKFYLTTLTHAKSSIRQYLSRAYISVQWMSDHTHFVSLSICLSIDLAFSYHIFHALKLLPLQPSQSRSYLHCEGHSNLGLICVGIYSGRFRLYFRSIRPTTTPITVAGN